MKKLEFQQMMNAEGGKEVTLGCAAMGAAAIWASSPLGPAALRIGTLTYAGCLLLES
ncbi:hypothetical protein ACFSUS_08380 [Spirosoma soli]|uniref:Class IIb bacteriocin, lactobin A/cerein 7B family n=1 Tax=Spirosoma soli TaxID=1770529 RepID=A0ABW5M2X4_9BACT